MVQFSYRYNMADDVNFSTMVQSLDQAEQRAAWKKESKRKQSIIPITNQDELCCARAIVTMRAWCHRNDPGCRSWNEWRTLLQGRPRQEKRARELHQAAGVREGPCGLSELETFQRYLSPNYQLKVLSRQHPFFLIFRGPDAPHLIMLLKGGNRYDGCTITGVINVIKRLVIRENMLVKGGHDVLSSQAFSPSEFLQASLAPVQPMGVMTSFSSVLLIGSFMCHKTFTRFIFSFSLTRPDQTLQCR